MPKPEPITAETVANIAKQFLGEPLSDANAAAAAALLNGLAADMRAFRAVKLGDEEPATTYAAIEGHP